MNSQRNPNGKQTAVPAIRTEGQDRTPPEAWADRHLSGQGSESALAHLRDIEGHRVDKNAAPPMPDSTC